MEGKWLRLRGWDLDHVEERIHLYHSALRRKIWGSWVRVVAV